MKSPEEIFQARVLVPALERLKKAGVLNYFHVPNGGYRRKAEAGILKAMGASAGVPDLVVVWYQDVGFIEVKRPWHKDCGHARGTLSTSQKEWRDSLLFNGHKWKLVESLDDMLDALKEWGVIKGEGK